MTAIALFPSVLGVRPGILDAAQRLRQAGHDVLVVDLYGGRTFDESLAALSELPSLYTEPDGSFAWNSLPGEERWQLSGCMYDRGPDLAYVDLFGQCESRSLATFLDQLRGPSSQLMVQLRERGTFVTTEAFLVGWAS